MASNNRRKKRDRKPNLPQPAAVRQPRQRPGAGAASGPVAAAETQDLKSMYSHVRRDLFRIAILGTLLCAAIYGSQFVAL